MSSFVDEGREASSGRLGRLLRPYAGRLLCVVILLGALALTNMALPYIVKRLIDDVFPQIDVEVATQGAAAAGDGSASAGGDWGLLWIILPALVVIYVVRNVLFFSSRMVSVRISEDLCFSLRKRLFDHLQQLGLRFYKSNQPGRVGSRVMDDTFKIQSFIQEKLPTLILNILMFLVLIVILYRVNPALAVASTIILPLHFAAYAVFKLPIKRSHSQAQENLASAYSNIVEKFLGMEVVKGFTAERRESARFRDALDASRESQIRSSRFQFGQKVVADLLVGAGTVLLFGFGAWQVMHGHMSGGTFFMFFGYVGMLYPAVIEVISGMGHLSKTTASVDRVYEMLDEPTPELTLGVDDGAKDAPALQGAIEYRDVGFAYETGHHILRGMTFSVQPGEHIAITGPSGSGKTTAVSLLPRFIAADRGEVLIDGVNALEYPIKSLRNAIGIAFQEVFLFNTSIYENLRYARPNATPEEVIDACRVTGAHDFIKRLPNGYQTRIGEAGAELSRGEKQRLTLARALLKDPSILILDEATASIDSGSARDIITRIFDLMKGRTVIMVTHETDLLDIADRVISVNRGRVEFDGSPDEYAGFEPSRDLNEETGEISIVDGAFFGLGSPASSRGAGASDPTAATGHPEARPHSPRPRTPFGGGFASVLALGVLFLIGCVSDSESHRKIELVEARTNGGWVSRDPDQPEDLDRLAESLLVNEAVSSARSAAEDVEPPFDPARLATELETNLERLNLGLLSTASTPEGLTPQGLALAAQPADATAPELEPVPIIPSFDFPPESSRLIDLPRLSETELIELIEGMALRAQTEMGYGRATEARRAVLPAPPEGVREVATLARRADEGERMIRIGYRQFLSQPPKLWIAAGLINGETVTPNNDLETLVTTIDPQIQALTQSRATMSAKDLQAKLIQLNFTDAGNALIALKALGVTTFPDPNGIPPNMNFEQLPIVAAMPEPTAEQIGLVGKATVITGGPRGLSMTPTVASELNADTIGTPLNQLLILFHPAHPEQYSHVRKLLDSFVDTKAKQIFVEGMVLEISEDGLQDLGIEWSFEEGPIEWMIGSLEAGGLEDTFSFNRVDSRDLPRDWSVQIRALIREGKAEILSRPSVLTLNGRQATIRVGEDIPIATSQEGFASSSNKVSFSFDYLATGILLNVRPRISEEGDEVNMLIDTIVSAIVPGRDLEIRSNEGEILASAPTISTRRVQTYGRIPNNTPFIIGGLVSRDHQVVQDKVPLLGDIPIIGMAFRSERVNTTKREVIIVLTPHVIEEDSPVARTLPKDADYFDSFGNELFRDGYRIRSEDVFDLRFLRENRRLMAYATVARQLIARNYRLQSVEPFSHFAGGRIPGEAVLVHRMIYEVVKRLDAAEIIDPTRIIYFARQLGPGGYDVEFLDETLADLADSRRSRDFFKRNESKALAITFYYDRESLDPDHLASEPVPVVEVIECTDREWGDLLWELNQPVNGRQRYTILIHDESDLIRLRQAIMLKRIISMNGGEGAVSLQNFSVGKFLLMPEVKPDQTHVIDADVARLFFNTEHYYAATIQAIENSLVEMDATLRESGLRGLLRDAVMDATRDGGNPVNDIQ